MMLRSWASASTLVGRLMVSSPASSSEDSSSSVLSPGSVVASADVPSEAGAAADSETESFA